MNLDLNPIPRLCRVDADWSAIEPREGLFDEEAIGRCRRELQALADRGLRPLLTLHHLSCPQWLDQRGAFASSDNITYYLRFVHKMVESAGDLAGDYITLSEPNLYAYRCCMEGALPPYKKNLLDTARTMTNLAAAHIEAYGLIRRTRRAMGLTDTRVGCALHLRFLLPADPADPVQRFRASQTGQLFQSGIARAMYTGRVSFPIGRHPSIVPGRYCDFHALGGWGRTVLGGDAGARQPDREAGDLEALCRSLCRLLPRPILLPAGAPALPEDLKVERCWDSPPEGI